MFNSLFKLNYENETSNSILLCPICKNELLKIVSISYDDSVNDYIINYNCSLKSNNKTPQKINLKSLLYLKIRAQILQKIFLHIALTMNLTPPHFFVQSATIIYAKTVIKSIYYMNKIMTISKNCMKRKKIVKFIRIKN